MSVLSMQFVRREMHSADGRTYIDRVGDHRWLVVVAGIGRSSHWARSSARTQIRALKAVAAGAHGRQCVTLGPLPDPVCTPGLAAAAKVVKR